MYIVRIYISKVNLFSCEHKLSKYIIYIFAWVTIFIKVVAHLAQHVHANVTWATSGSTSSSCNSHLSHIWLNMQLMQQSPEPHLAQHAANAAIPCVTSGSTNSSCKRHLRHIWLNKQLMQPSHVSHLAQQTAHANVTWATSGSTSSPCSQHQSHFIISLTQKFININLRPAELLSRITRHTIRPP